VSIGEDEVRCGVFSILAVWAVLSLPGAVPADESGRPVPAGVEEARTALLEGRRGDARELLLEHYRKDPEDPLVKFLLARSGTKPDADAHVFTDVPEPVSSAHLSRDGKRLLIVGGTHEGTATVWNLDDDALVSEMKGHQGPADGQISADGRYVLTVRVGGGAARLWNAESGDLLYALRHDRGLERAAFSPNGKQVATLGNSRLRTWDPSSGSLLCDVEARHGYVVYRVGYDPSGRRIVTTALNGAIRVWDADTCHLVSEHTGQSTLVGTVFFDPSGSRVVASGKDGRALVIGAESGEIQVEISGHEGRVWSARFSADGTRIVTCGEDGNAIIWRAEDGKKMATLPHAGPVYGAVFDPTSSFVATACLDGNVRVWYAATGSLVFEFEPDTARTPVDSIEYSASGSLLVSRSMTGVYVLDVHLEDREPSDLSRRPSSED
jgi:WD40 repeat protein